MKARQKSSTCLLPGLDTDPVLDLYRVSSGTDGYQYLYPPRPERTISASMLPYYEKKGWWAQWKLNGDCINLALHPASNTVVVMNRHAEEPKLWRGSKGLFLPLMQHLPQQGWTQLICELLHNKTPEIKNTFYIFDCIMLASRQLVGQTYQSRQMLLSNMFPVVGEAPSHLVVEDHLWVARNFREDFQELWSRATVGTENEGLVLKNPQAKMLPCFQASSNAGWQVKCRRPHKNYAH